MPKTGENSETISNELSVRYVSIALLEKNSRNARKHPRSQINQLALSIQSFGNNVPILIDKDMHVICGHGRLLACQQLGIQEIPTIQLDHLTKPQAAAFAIADNRLTDMSAWDDRILAETLQELSAHDLNFDIEATGFSLDAIDVQIENILGQPETDPDDKMPDVSEGPAVCRAGDLFVLNHHRLLCGDATNPADLQMLMNGQRADMAFTDPPYNVDYASEHAEHRPILNDALGKGFKVFLLATCQNILSVTNGAIYICMSSSELSILQTAFIEAGGYWSTFIMWVKNTFTLGRSDYQRQYEPILYGWRQGVKRHWCGARGQGDAWFFDRPIRNDLHPTMKPVGLVIRAIRNSSNRGALILDPFLGSGTTLIAAERTKRICYGIELDPIYVDISVRRWQLHTGLKAVHAATGKTFDEMEKEMINV